MLFTVFPGRREGEGDNDREREREKERGELVVLLNEGVNV